MQIAITTISTLQQHQMIIHTSVSQNATTCYHPAIDPTCLRLINLLCSIVESNYNIAPQLPIFNDNDNNMINQAPINNTNATHEFAQQTNNNLENNIFQNHHNSENEEQQNHNTSVNSNNKQENWETPKNPIKRPASPSPKFNDSNMHAILDTSDSDDNDIGIDSSTSSDASENNKQTFQKEISIWGFMVLWDFFRYVLWGTYFLRSLLIIRTV